MKRSVAAAIALAFLALVMLSQATTSTARVSPLPTDDALGAAVSPLATPLPHWEMSYNPHPKKIKPRAVPFVNEVGETIVKQTILERPNQDSIVINEKAQAMSPLTFQSPLSNPGPYDVYLPLLKSPGNAQVLVIAYIGYTPTYTPTDLASNLIGLISQGTSFHGREKSATGFEMVGNHVEISNTRAPHRPDMKWDMWKIYANHNICNR